MSSTTRTKTSWPGPRLDTASSSVSRRAIRMYGSRLATAARRSPPPAPANTSQITRENGDPRPGHIPTPPRPRPDRARPALPQGLAATLLALIYLGYSRFWARYRAEQRKNITLADGEYTGNLIPVRSRTKKPPHLGGCGGKSELGSER